MTDRLDDRLVAAWRLSIEHAAVRLGEFRWPWALGMALDEIDRLRAELAAAQEREARVRAETHVEDGKPIVPPSECACWVEGWDHAIDEMWRRLRAALADPAPSGETP